MLAGVVPSPYSEDLPQVDLHRYRELFGDGSYLLAEPYQGPHDHCRIQRLRELLRTYQLPLGAAGNVLFHVLARKILHDVLTATRYRKTVATAGELLLPNARRHLHSIEERSELCARRPDALSRMVEIAGQCTFSLNEPRYEYPEELAAPGQTLLGYRS